MDFIKHSYTSNRRIATSGLAEEMVSGDGIAYPLPSHASCSECESANNVPVTTYFIFSEKINTRETKEFKTYGIAAYHYLSALPERIVRDVSLNGEFVFSMVRMLNKHKLSPLHLKDVILDMLG